MLFFVLATLVTFRLPGDAWAFHEGGADFCEGCHVVHKSRSGPAQNGYDSSNPGELKGLDSSSTCLRCHAERGKFYNVLSHDGSTYSAGGDFYWLKKTFTWRKYGVHYQSLGNNHGHNVVAVEYGLNEEGTLSSAPGGIYSSTALGCTSCHNPHSRTVKEGYAGEISVANSNGEDLIIVTSVGNYRLLGGLGYTGGVQARGVTFKYPAPVAMADSHDWVETDANHTAYGSGMSEWCSNCHPDFLNSGNKLPAGNGAKLNTAIISNYNSYVSTGPVRRRKCDVPDMPPGPRFRLRKYWKMGFWNHFHRRLTPTAW